MFYFPITKLEFQGVSFLTWFSHDVKQFLQEGKSLKHGWHANLLVFIGMSWRHMMVVGLNDLQIWSLQ